MKKIVLFPKLREKHPALRVVLEWVEAIVFAVVVATLVHIFVFQMYVIPSPSMEKTLLVGDYLYVSKLTYGPKLPNTPLAVPLVHNTMPLSKTGAKSYSEAVHWRYRRLGSLKRLKRDDVVVFNYPADTMIARPVGKRENYVKRCIALPGDSLQIVASQVYVNGVAQKPISGLQQMYYVSTDTPFPSKTLADLGITQEDVYYNPPTGEYLLPLTEANLEKMRAMSNVVYVEQYERGSSTEIFPNTTDNQWTETDFGPLWIPAKGSTVVLTLNNLPLYRRIIDEYEENELEVRDGVIYINGVAETEYTFRMNYYWMMGDNRQNSLDSRYWGFVPEDHVVGKASFVWLSLDKEKGWFNGKIRWNKMFRAVR